MRLILIILLPFLGSLGAAFLPSDICKGSMAGGSYALTTVLLVISLYPQVIGARWHRAHHGFMDSGAGSGFFLADGRLRLAVETGTRDLHRLSSPHRLMPMTATLARMEKYNFSGT